MKNTFQDILDSNRLPGSDGPPDAPTKSAIEDFLKVAPAAKSKTFDAVFHTKCFNLLKKHC